MAGQGTSIKFRCMAAEPEVALPWLGCIIGYGPVGVGVLPCPLRRCLTLTPSCGPINPNLKGNC